MTTNLNNLISLALVWTMDMDHWFLIHHNKPHFLNGPDRSDLIHLYLFFRVIFVCFCFSDDLNLIKWNRYRISEQWKWWWARIVIISSLQFSRYFLFFLTAEIHRFCFSVKMSFRFNYYKEHYSHRFVWFEMYWNGIIHLMRWHPILNNEKSAFHICQVGQWSMAYYISILISKFSFWSFFSYFRLNIFIWFACSNSNRINRYRWVFLRWNSQLKQSVWHSAIAYKPFIWIFTA